MIKTDHRPMGTYRYNHLGEKKEEKVMKDKIVYKKSVDCIVYQWTVESFNEVTGNKCKAFRPNRYIAPDF